MGPSYEKVYMCVCGGGGGVFGPHFVIQYLLPSFATVSLRERELKLN